ncbi:MAG: Y-family DNA polymerase [Alphaproteobacteria bacterium]|nr:Y-family DNA polymerase [Alphaproteobacteria bacterium]
MPFFALVDCNNFYVSCERVFNPQLQHRPVAILSNNDGCVVSRSEESKKLGLPMGAPYFKYESFIRQNGIMVFSSNYTLYGDMSNRVMETLRPASDMMEIYSIDEAFLRWNDPLPPNLFDQVCALRRRVKQWTGIPVSIGLAPTKTLAKIAANIAKNQCHESVFDISKPTQQNKVLATFKVDDVWGVSDGLGKRLREMGVYSALDLKNSDPAFMRRHLTVVVERIVRELNGQSCIPMEGIGPRRNIMYSRSFGRPVYQLSELQQAIADYTSRAAQKMRRQGSLAQAIHVFIATSRHQDGANRYYAGLTVGLSSATDNSSNLLKQAQRMINDIFKPNRRYQKAGITLLNLTQNTQPAANLFADSAKPDQLMQVMDQINRQFGHDKIFLAAQGTTRPWQMRCKMRSPFYTTNWDKLVTVKA